MIDTDIKLDEKIKKEITLPPKYNVIFLNDNSTPIDFVIEVLQAIFQHSLETSKKLTMTIHNEESAVVGTYNYEIAEQKTIETTNTARQQGFPLQVRLDQE